MTRPIPHERREAFAGTLPLGRRPAVLVVDACRGFTEPGSPTSCDAYEAVEAMAEVLGAARQAGTPVIFTTIAYDEEGERTAGVFLTKVPALLVLRPGTSWIEIDPRLARRADEPVVTKLFPSAFFATPLATMLAVRGCDTLIVMGASTSGCVRATVVDAVQYGCVPVVPRETVADRDPAAHAQALKDMQAKYANVTSQAEVVQYLQRATD